MGSATSLRKSKPRMENGMAFSRCEITAIRK